MGHLLKLICTFKCPMSALASTSVPFSPTTTVQMPNLALIETKQITVRQNNRLLSYCSILQEYQKPAWVTRWQDNRLLSKLQYIAGVQDAWVTWWQDNRLLSKLQYNAGVPEALVTWWQDNRLLSKLQYNAGVPEPAWVT